MSSSRTPPYLAKQPSFLANPSPHIETERSDSISVPSPPSHRGAHRDGFSVEKCRDVLVRHCSRIPRNYSFKDGIHRVYWILREYLGDENMDLAIAQLYELIELPSDWTDDEGAAFQSWKHDYMLKNKDFENPHVPRLGNVIVAPIRPSERLQKWRQEQGEHKTCNLSSSQSSQTAPSIVKASSFGSSFGLRPRGHGGWRVDMALFVSNKAEGTRVLHCPTPQELHKKTWDVDFGRGGRLIQERTIVPGEPIDPISTSDRNDSLSQDTPFYMRKKSLSNSRPIKPLPTIPFIPTNSSTTLRIPTIIKNAFTLCRSGGIRHRLSKTDISENESWRPQYSQFPDPLLRHYLDDVKAYESNKAVKELPNPYTDAGKIYYRNIKSQSLDLGMAVPNPAFARKHGLRAQPISVHKWIDCKLMPTAEDIAIQRGFREHEESIIQTSLKCFNGPFTAEMFKDSGIDFPIRWQTTEGLLFSDDGHCNILSDMRSLVDGAQSPSKNVLCVRKCINEHVVHTDCPTSDAARARHCVENSTNQPCSYLRQGGLILYRQTIELRGGAGRKCRWGNVFTCRLMSKIRIQSTARRECLASESRLQSESPPGSTQSLIDVYAANFLSDLSSKPQQRIDLKLIKSHLSSFSIHIFGAIATQFTTVQKKIIHFPSSIMADSHGEEIVPAVKRLQGSSAMISCKSKASAEQIEPPSCRFSTSLGHCTSQTRHTPSFNPQMTPFVKSTAAPISGLTPTSDVCGSPKLILEVRPAHETSKKLSRGIEDPHAEMVILPMRVSLETQWESRGNNKQHDADASNGKEYEYSKTLTGKLSSFPATSRYTRKSSFPLDYEVFSESPTPYLAVEHKMDLNRELPPLPISNPVMPLRIRKASQERQLIKSEKLEPEHLLQTRYDPTRDGLKYGGIQYHPEGIRYWPEGSQYQLHTSSPVSASTYAMTSSKPIYIEPKASKIPRTRAAVNCATRVSKRHVESSTGIMGNFMPLAPSNKVLHFVTESETMPLKKEKLGKKSPTDFAEQCNFSYRVPEYHVGHTRQPKGLSKQLDRDTSEAMDEYAGDDTFMDIEQPGYQKTPPFNHLFESYQNLGGGNPFEYEGEIHDKNSDRMTTFTDFISEADTQEPQKPLTQKKLGHIKNSRSESNALYMANRPAPILIDRPRPLGCSRQRSDSSPSISPTRQLQDTATNCRGFSRSEDEHKHISSTRQSHAECNPVESLPRGRGLRSPVKRLADVPEKDENTTEQTLASPKRPRSPLKKIFGEGGWLSNAVGPKEELSNQRKLGLMDKIKNKMEEIGLKADVSPTKNVIEINDDKKSVPSTFPISLDPAQQADVYSAVELLICNTANTFLMHQYQNCRMSVDSLKKVIDFWKGKGRPQVMEFRYDQSTQRDLIVANQKNFHFFGPNANDPLRVNAMLYAWKHDAREMSIRTFCYPDSLIRNHLRDSFLILDFLGGHPAQYLTLYEVRAKFTRWVEEAQQLLAVRYSTGSWVERGEINPRGSSSEHVTGSLLGPSMISGGSQSTTTSSNPKYCVDNSSVLNDGGESSDQYKSKLHQDSNKEYFTISSGDTRGR